jgi:hypothetical protein
MYNHSPHSGTGFFQNLFGRFPGGNNVSAFGFWPHTPPHRISVIQDKDFSR